MSKDYSFSVMPSVSISRSRFARKSQHKTSFNLGTIVPIYCDEVLPGDTRSLDMASLVRMSTPIAPIMDNIYIDYFGFFVPNRIVWDHWKEFMGENNTSAGIPSTTYTVPKAISGSSATPDKNSLLSYLGLPVVSGVANAISALPLRGLAKIYNRWFRNQNVIAPLPVYTGDLAGCLTGASDNANFLHNGDFLKASKFPDYFTSALPYAQKGAAVSIPLGTTAPLIVSSSIDFNNTGYKAIGFAPAQVSSRSINLQYNGQSYDTVVNNIDGVDQLDHQHPVSIYADLTSATAAKINDLRYAFQLQKFLEKDALYGSRYWEILSAHFGIQAPDATLQDPEYLGGYRQRVNIDQVLSTAGYDDTSATDVGKPGANSVTGGKSSLFTKSFVEHGFIFILAVARHDQTYSQGINRMWSRSSRYDYYFPVFANLGAQEVKLKELYFTNTSADNNVFGYQEAWAEYRYKPSIATGLLNPTIANSLDFWTLTNNFATAPTLGQAFMEQSRANLARALATGFTGPDFIADFYFRDIAVRPMPMYSIPGLIDHH